jgi:5-oxopent-3-ene-1,2,5-tricarboxylate decarboxylase / 2-hydroxyhepta-2,4-diene-1,7-dioate isomerase
MLVNQPPVQIDFAPWALSGTVLGVLMNHRPALAALGDAVFQPPYKAPPQAPVLYVKPRNTWLASGGVVTVPADAPELQLGASLAAVIGRTAHGVPAAQALDHVAGWLLVADVCVPHAVYYRPSLRWRVRDGFCPLGPAVVPRDAVPQPDALTLTVELDGQVVHQPSTGDRVRDIATLIADVSRFMTLQPGDVLMLGVADGAPRVRAGQSARITAPGLAPLAMHFVAEGRT